MVKVSGDDAVQLLLLVLTVLNGQPLHVDGGVVIQPLFPKHHKEGGEE